MGWMLLTVALAGGLIGIVHLALSMASRGRRPVSRHLKVNIKAGAGSGGTAMVDDAAFTPATTSGTPAFFLFDDVSPDSVNEGDGGIGRMSANRNQYVTLRDAAGNERGLNIDASGNLTANITGTVTVGAHAVTNAGTFATQPTSVVPGTGATNLGKAEDAAHSSGDTGVMLLGVRNPSLLSFTDAVGDYSPFSLSGLGELYVTTSTLNPGTGAAALGKAEDGAHTSGDVGVMALCVRQDTAAALATTNGDYIPCTTDASGKMWTNADTELPAAASLADTTANPTVPGVGSYNMCWNGSTWDRCVKASAGAGNSDSSTQRVVVARDSDVCNAKDTAQVVISTASSGNVELVALTSGQTIYLCDFTIMAGGTVGVQLIYGTGTACATGETNMTGVLPLVINSGWTHNYGGRLKTAEANAFCIELSGAVQVDGVATYRKMGTF